MDSNTHEVVSAEVSLVNVADNEVLPTLFNPLRRHIAQVSADGAYDTKALMSNQLSQWKEDNDYYGRSLSETAMYRYKQLISPKLSFRDYNGQLGEALAGVKAMNKVIGLGIPVR